MRKLILLGLLVLAGCGGGGGSDTQSSPYSLKIEGDRPYLYGHWYRVRAFKDGRELAPEEWSLGAGSKAGQGRIRGWDRNGAHGFIGIDPADSTAFLSVHLPDTIHAAYQEDVRYLKGETNDLKVSTKAQGFPTPIRFRIVFDGEIESAPHKPDSFGNAVVPVPSTATDVRVYIADEEHVLYDGERFDNNEAGYAEIPIREGEMVLDVRID